MCGSNLIPKVTGQAPAHSRGPFSCAPHIWGNSGAARGPQRAGIGWRFPGVASINNSWPAKYSYVTVTVDVTNFLGRLVQGARVALMVHHRTKDGTFDAGASGDCGSDGEGRGGAALRLDNEKG